MKGGRGEKVLVLGSGCPRKNVFLKLRMGFLEHFNAYQELYEISRFINVSQFIPMILSFQKMNTANWKNTKKSL